MGTMFRVEDYLIAYGLDFLLPAALFISILLCTVEFTLGFALFFNLRIRLTTWLTTAIMLFFTAITLYDALYTPVPDCGCFGDAIILTNWQTFWKNIILLVFVALIIFTLPAKPKKDKKMWQYGFILLGAFGFSLFSLQCFRGLPPIDFMKWKTGTELYASDAPPPKFYVTYKNNASGEVKEYPADNYPFNDSIWMTQWSFVSSRVDDPGAGSKPDLLIFDSLGTDYTEHFLKNPGLQFILTSYDLETMGNADFEKINKLAYQLESEGHSFIFLTASSGKTLNDFLKKNPVSFEIYHADDVPIKTMVRANPGLILLKNKKVADKWNWRDIPEFEKLKNRIATLP